jgi:hypothetical protein
VAESENDADGPFTHKTTPITSSEPCESVAFRSYNSCPVIDEEQNFTVNDRHADNFLYA